MLIDTHCHLDDTVFDKDRALVLQRAQDAGVAHIVVPAISPANFDAVRQAAADYPGGAYALGIHPLCIPSASQNDLARLELAIKSALDDPRFVAIGEIGLDFFVAELKTPAMQAKQEDFYQAQLKLAQRYQLPVLLHVRRAQDRILMYLRRCSGVSGIAHAFNGSMQQAQQFIELGFALGAGGAMTFTRARQIRRLASELPLQHWVLETDAPDIPPAWLTPKNDKPARNEPAELLGIAQALADLRGVALDSVLQATAATAFRVLPRLSLIDNSGT